MSATHNDCILLCSASGDIIFKWKSKTTTERFLKNISAQMRAGHIYKQPKLKFQTDSRCINSETFRHGSKKTNKEARSKYLRDCQT